MMNIAYFVNQYPKVSHSFIRREMLALETLGIVVSRYALRGWADSLVDVEDIRERVRTRYILQRGITGLIAPVVRCLLKRPSSFFRALWLALQLSRRADRPLPLHLVYFAEACQLLRWLEAHPVDHVHAHFGTNSTEVVMLAHALGGPGYSFTVHGPEEFDKPEALHLGDKINNSRFVVAISSFGRSQLYRWTNFQDWSKVQVVHCGLESEFYEVSPVPVPAAPRLVCIGRLCEQKGQLLLVEAAKRLRDRSIRFELVLAGDGEMRSEVDRLVTQYGLQQQVRVTGWISAAQVRAELQASRALVLPSFAEGLPVVIMEAMALARPVITTSIAGIPELVLHGDHGWLVSAGDVDVLVKAMEECLLASPDQLQKMGDDARIRVLQRHDIAIEAGKLADCFRRCVREGAL